VYMFQIVLDLTAQKCALVKFETFEAITGFLKNFSNNIPK